MTKHQLPINYQITNDQNLVIVTCKLVISAEGRLYGAKKEGK